MEREFESYNKNIDDFDARNIFEYDIQKELNMYNQPKAKKDKEHKSRKIQLFREEKKPKANFN